MAEDSLKEIRKACDEIDLEKIILFGSRARGDYHDKSDFDILIIVKEEISIEEKMRTTAIIRKKLAKLGIDADVIVKSEAEVEYYKKKIGSIVDMTPGS